jgi:thiol-disulfide isomerase/thioredoxin
MSNSQIYSQINRRSVMQTAAQTGLALAVGGAFGIGSAWAKGSGPALPKVGSVLRLPDLKLLDASVWRASNVQQKALVVYWWASWCPFCAVQSPHIEALWRTWKDKGLSVLALSIDAKPAAASAYIKAKNYSFPAAMLTSEVAKSLPKPAGLPVVVVLKVAATRQGSEGGEGKVVFAEAGEMFPEDIEGLKKYI